MSYVKHRTTHEQRLAVRMLWHSTNRETYSAEFLGVVFDLSRPTILELCASVPRVGAEFDFDSLRAGWSADRQRRSLAVDDASWITALIAASEYAENRLITSSTNLRVLSEHAQALTMRNAA
jgi:hypothetical protein